MYNRFNKFERGMFIIFSIIITSCSNNDLVEQTYVYKSEKLNLTEFINSHGDKTARILNKSAKIDYIHSEFETTFYISKDLSQTEKENYILENQSVIDGKIKYFINDDVFFEVEISAGKKIRPTPYDYASIFSMFIQGDKYPDKDECSYDGIQDCVQFAIYEEWTTVEAIFCAVTGGLDCILVEAAACIETNCY